MILTRDGKEITAIYSQDGSEVEELKDENGRIVYLASREITGTPPLYFSSRGKPLADYLISGNTVQDGTPSPEAPIIPSGCGDRTKNLFDKDNADITHLYPLQDGTTFAQGGDNTWSIILPCKPNTTYTLSKNILSYSSPRHRVSGSEEYPTAGGAQTFMGNISESISGDPRACQIFTTTATTHWIVCFLYSPTTYEALLEQLQSLQLEEANDKTAYEPYGYKIPIETSEDVLVNNLTSKIIHGLTVTVNNDGEISVKGTATSTTALWLYNDTTVLSANSYQEIEDGEYVIGKGITGSSAGTYQLIFRCGNSTKTEENTLVRIPPDGEIRFTNHNGDHKYIAMYVAVWSGQTVDFTCKPYLKAVKTVSNIYLGEVPTTRRIRKLVLTGEEDWILTSKNSHGIVNFRYPGTIDDRLATIGNVLSSHLTMSLSSNADATNESIRITGDLVLYLRRLESKIPTVTALRQWLSDQYAAGTPITVWYVLATPETGIVNEPLHKIGDYADTVSYAQAGVTIPTVSGTNILDTTFAVKPSEVYIKGKGIKPIGNGG